MRLSLLFVVFRFVWCQGGSKEIFANQPSSKETRLVLNNRLGFVRLAIRHGAELVSD